jgi:hypothetical protein
VVSVEVVPVERVRLRTEVVQGQQRITDQVQREQIVVDQTPTGQAGWDQGGQAVTGQPGHAAAGQAVPPGTVPPR